MSKIFAFIFLSIALFIASVKVQAQQRLQFKVGYNTGMPVGSFKNFMNENSFRGYLAELNYGVNEKLKVGLGISFNDYYEKIPRTLYETKDGIISAVVSNSIQTTPILFKASYELTDAAFIRPYAGAGAGFNLIGFTQYVGEFGEKKTAFKPAAAAEAGINIPFNRETRASGINIGAHFNYLPYKSEYTKNLNNWGVHAAVFFPLK
jgi:opacity protein-like surface antigen